MLVYGVVCMYGVGCVALRRPNEAETVASWLTVCNSRLFSYMCACMCVSGEIVHAVLFYLSDIALTTCPACSDIIINRWIPAGRYKSQSLQNSLKLRTYVRLGW